MRFSLCERFMLPDNLDISAERSRLDVAWIHSFLSTSSYWAQGRPREVVETTIANSLCFGAYIGAEQIAFGRVVTDGAIIGYVADVFVGSTWRGRGVGKALMRAVLEHPVVSKLQVVLLRTTGAQGLYAQLGFGPVPKPHELMGRYVAHIDAE